MWECVFPRGALQLCRRWGLPRCTPRTPAGYKTTARGRFPGSRVAALARLPRFPQWHLDESSPVTVAGAAKVLNLIPYTLHLLVVYCARGAPSIRLWPPSVATRVCIPQTSPCDSSPRLWLRHVGGASLCFLRLPLLAGVAKPG